MSGKLIRKAYITKSTYMPQFYNGS